MCISRPRFARNFRKIQSCKVEKLASRFRKRGENVFAIVRSGKPSVKWVEVFVVSLGVLVQRDEEQGRTFRESDLFELRKGLLLFS